MIEQRDPAQTFDGPAPLRLGISIPSGELSPSPSHSVDRTIRRANPKKNSGIKDPCPVFLSLLLSSGMEHESFHALQCSTAQQTLISCMYVRMRNPEVVHPGFAMPTPAFSKKSASFDV